MFCILYTCTGILNYPGLPSDVLGCPRISAGDREGVGFGFGVGNRGLGTS